MYFIASFSCTTSFLLNHTCIVSRDCEAQFTCQSSTCWSLTLDGSQTQIFSIHQALTASGAQCVPIHERNFRWWWQLVPGEYTHISFVRDTLLTTDHKCTLTCSSTPFILTPPSAQKALEFGLIKKRKEKGLELETLSILQ